MVPRVLWKEILQELHAGALEDYLGRLAKFGSVLLARDTARCEAVDSHLPSM